MTKPTAKDREAFEAWAKSQGHDLTTETNDSGTPNVYADIGTWDLWQAWQAASAQARADERERCASIDYDPLTGVSALIGKTPRASRTTTIIRALSDAEGGSE